MAETATGVDAAFRSGDLDSAITQANQLVRRAPADIAARVLLAELLVFAGKLERADVLLEAAASIDASAAVAVAEFRQLLRAETARQQLRRDERLPEFLGEPTPAQRALLAALVALRGGDMAEAARCAEEAEAARPRAPGWLGERAFDDFRDADDLTAGVLEVLTTTGKFFWIPIERVTAIEFHKPLRPRDLAWRRATVSVVSGPEGDVYVPALYPSERTDISDALRLGRATEWTTYPPVQGCGRRVFLAGEEGIDIMMLSGLRFGS